MKKYFLFLSAIFLMPPCSAVPRNQFIQNILGRTEQNFKTMYTNDDPEIHQMVQSALNNAGQTVYHLQVNNHEFQCGYFEQLSIEELQTGTTHMAIPGNGTFCVIEAQSPVGTIFAHHVDIGALQADPNNADSVFQVASNFNGLETVQANQNIETQLLTEYIHDRTQGPFASISAAPGLIFRRYFLFYSPDTPVSSWGQTNAGDHKINFLEDITSSPNSCIAMSQAGYAQFQANIHAPIEQDYANIKIGFQGEVAVSHGRVINAQEHEQLNAPYPIISQVFTAAIDFGFTNQHVRNNQNAQLWGQQILNAAYEGTLRAACIKNKRRVFLTLVGGGVFENNFAAIGRAIARLQDFIIDSGLEVTLIWYDSQGDQVRGKNVDGLRTILEPLVRDTHGTWTIYNQASPNGLELQLQDPVQVSATIENAQPITEPIPTHQEPINVSVTDYLWISGQVIKSIFRF